jgi:uncharacterized protein YlaI
MPRAYVCDQCHEVIDEEEQKFVVHKEGTIYEKRLHASCVKDYLASHPDGLSN